MVRASLLLRCYPRSWRDKYGDEFLATIGGDGVPLSQVPDVITGAIDAWLSPDVHDVTGRLAFERRRATGAPPSTASPYTTRDSVIGAAVILLTTAALTLLSSIARAAGRPTLAAMLLNFGAFAALLVSMPFWSMKNYSRAARLLFVAVCLAVLAAFSYLSVAS